MKIFNTMTRKKEELTPLQVKLAELSRILTINLNDMAKELKIK